MVPFILISAGSLVAWGAWFYVLFQFDPLVASVMPKLLFYGSLGLALLGTFILVGIYLYKKRTGMMASRFEVGIISRQAVLFALFIITVLILAAGKLLKWWNILPLALLVFGIEWFFVSMQKKNPYTRTDNQHDSLK